MNKKQKLVVLDFTDGKVHIDHIPTEYNELEADEIVDAMGYDLSNVEYMVIENDLEIEVNLDNVKSSITIA